MALLTDFLPVGKGARQAALGCGGALQVAEKRVGAVIINATPYPLVSTTPALGAPPLLNQEGNCRNAPLLR